jgi:hypothetical protein
LTEVEDTGWATGALAGWDAGCATGGVEVEEAAGAAAVSPGEELVTGAFGSAGTVAAVASGGAAFGIG